MIKISRHRFVRNIVYANITRALVSARIKDLHSGAYSLMNFNERMMNRNYEIIQQEGLRNFTRIKLHGRR